MALNPLLKGLLKNTNQSFQAADDFLGSPGGNFALNLLAQQGYSTMPQSPVAAIGRAGLATQAQQSENAMNDAQMRLIESQIGLRQAQTRAALTPEPVETFSVLSEDEEAETFGQADPQGSYRRNDLTGKIERIGQTGTNVTLNTGTEQAFADRIAVGAADRFMEDAEGARTAMRNMATVNQAVSLIERGINSGQFANFQQGIGKTFNALGLTNDDSVVATEAYMATTARLVADILGSGAFGSGSGISEKDLEFVERMAANQIELDEDSMREILRITALVQGNIVSNFNSQRQRLLDFDTSGSIGPLLGPELLLPGTEDGITVTTVVPPDGS